MNFRILFVFIFLFATQNLFAQVDTSNADSLNLDDYKIQSFVFYIDNLKSDKYSYLEGSVFDTDKIDEILKNEYSNYVDSGYWNASATISKFDIDTLQRTVNIAGVLRKGELVKISDVVFSGNRLNSDNYLYKVAGIRDSIIANQQNLRQIKRNLISSELFEEVSDPVVYLDERQYLLYIRTQERNLNNLDGLIGYVPDANGDGQIVGDLNISLWNVIIEGNAFNFLYQRLKPETSRLNLGLEQHWIGGIPISLGFNFSFFQNDTTYQTRELALNAFYRINTELKLIGGVYSGSSVSGNNFISPEPDGNKQGSELGFEYSTLNSFDVPTSGIKLRVLYGIGNKDIEDDSLATFRQQSLSASINGYLPIFSRSVIATRLNGFYISGKELTENDLIRFGGANSFRGYAEEQFLASELIWGDAEYRFLTERSSYLFIFGAAGYYQRSRLYAEPNNSFEQNDFLYSGGFGISYKTQIGRLTFSYALSSTENIGNGKVHFGIKTGF